MDSGYPPDCTREVDLWVAERALEADGRGVVRRGVHGDVEHGAGQTLHRVRRAQRRHLTGPPPAAVTWCNVTTGCPKKTGKLLETATIPLKSNRNFNTDPFFGLYVWYKLCYGYLNICRSGEVVV